MVQINAMLRTILTWEMCHSGKKWWYKMINREISLIAAVSHNGIIGVDGKIPWNIPEDLNHFKKNQYRRK